MNYFIVSEGKQQGPYTVAELQARHITSDTLVWGEGMESWLPAWQVEELKAIVGEGSRLPEPPPVGGDEPRQPIGGGESRQPAAPPQSRQPAAEGHRHGHKGLLAVVVLLLVVAIMALTNPDRRDHSQAISREVTGALTSVADSAGLSDDPIAQGFLMIGQAFAGNIVDAAVNNLLRYNNYVVLSVGQIDFQGKTYTVSVGLLGHVWTMDRDEMVKAVESNGRIEVSRIINDHIDRGASAASKMVTDVMDSAAGQLSRQADKVVRELTSGIKGEVDKEVGRQIDQVADSTESGSIGRIIDDVRSALGI